MLGLTLFIVHLMSYDKYKISYIHHYSIIHSSFTALKIYLCFCSLSLPPDTQPGAEPRADSLKEFPRWTAPRNKTKIGQMRMQWSQRSSPEAFPGSTHGEKAVVQWKQSSTPSCPGSLPVLAVFCASLTDPFYKPLGLSFVICEMGNIIAPTT